MVDVSPQPSSDTFVPRRRYVSGYVRTPQSGLPLEFLDSHPVAPAMTTAILNQLMVKRLVDIVISSLALIALAPVFCAIALAILLSGGRSPLDQRPAVGRDGRIFMLVSFRTPPGVGNRGCAPALDALLEHTRLDRLPALINVLFGDMSLVGPEPHAPATYAAGFRYEVLVPYYDMRESMRPGLTGWAQVNGLEGPIATPHLAWARLDHDVAYIQHFSLALDAKIVLQGLCARR